jgi:hypothetical protein
MCSCSMVLTSITRSTIGFTWAVLGTQLTTSMPIDLLTPGTTRAPTLFSRLVT